MEKSIEHLGKVYHFFCTWGDGGYYRSDDRGFVLTDKNGDVEISSAFFPSVEKLI